MQKAFTRGPISFASLRFWCHALQTESTLCRLSSYFCTFFFLSKSINISNYRYVEHLLNCLSCLAGHCHLAEPRHCVAYQSPCVTKYSSYGAPPSAVATWPPRWTVLGVAQLAYVESVATGFHCVSHHATIGLTLVRWHDIWSRTSVSLVTHRQLVRESSSQRLVPRCWKYQR